MIKIGFKKAVPDAKLPEYAHEGDAGMDVYAAADVKLTPGMPTLVSTGLIAEIPDGFEVQVRPRSGLALKEGITVWNSPGTVDSGYRGVIGVIMYLSPCASRRRDLNAITYTMAIEGNDEYEIHKGDKIAQLVVAPVTKCIPFEVQEVGDTDRGAGGFGSTGK